MTMTTMTGHYYKNKKLYTYEMTEAEALEASRQWRKTKYAMKKAEEELLKQYRIDHRNGYCPHCFLLIPIGGQCECGGE